MPTATLNEKYQEVEIVKHGSFRYWDAERRVNCSANFALHLIQMAWSSGCSFEDIADGFGKGRGTMGGDWSGIRDSSDEATRQMLAVALQYIHDKLTQ